MAASRSDTEEPALGDDLAFLLEQLAAAGLRIGPRERVRANALVADLVAHGQVRTLADLAPWLAPLLARSPAERARFQQVLGLVSAGVAADSEPATEAGEGDGGATRRALVYVLVAVLIAAIAFGIWRSWSPRPVDPPGPTVPDNTPVATSTGPAPATAPAPPASLKALNRIAKAAERFEGAPTLDELGRELAKSSPIGWRGTSYAVRMHELSGLPRSWPLALYRDGGRQWAMAALALERIERPGPEPAFGEMLAAAQSALAQQTDVQRPVYDLAARLGDWAPDDIPRDKRALIERIQQRALVERTGTSSLPSGAEALDPLIVERALAIATDRRLRRVFADAPWIVRGGPPGWPWWTPWLAVLVALALVAWVAANSVALRKVYLRRRPPEFPPLHLSLVSEAAHLAHGPAATFQRMAQRLKTRTADATDRIDVEASIAATLAGGGELVTPVHEASLRTPEYLVLVERQSAGDQDARRLRHLAGRLAAYLPMTCFFYRDDPAYVESEHGSSIPIEQLQAQYSRHRLLILGSGADFLDPVTLRPRPASEKLTFWSRRALLTSLPLAEWGREEFALSAALQMPIGRATPEGLDHLARMLGLEGAEADTLFYTEGDGTARPLPDILRVHPWRFLYTAPPCDTAPDELIRQLRNVLDAPAFEWLCALAIYPAVQWDLTLYLGFTLAERAGADPARAPLYREDRIAALTQLPWLRQGLMPNWLRRVLIEEFDPARAAEARASLMRLIEAAQPTGDSRHDEAVRLRIAREPARDRLPAEALMQDEVLVDFLARGRIEDLALPSAKWLERLLPHRLLDRMGIPETVASLVAVTYAVAAYALSPGPSDAALPTAMWLPLLVLLLGGGVVAMATDPGAAYARLRSFLVRNAACWLALPILAALLIAPVLALQLLRGAPLDPSAVAAPDTPLSLGTLIPVAALALVLAGWLARRPSLPFGLPPPAPSAVLVSVLVVGPPVLMLWVLTSIGVGWTLSALVTASLMAWVLTGWTAHRLSGLRQAGVSAGIGAVAISVTVFILWPIRHVVNWWTVLILIPVSLTTGWIARAVATRAELPRFSPRDVFATAIRILMLCAALLSVQALFLPGGDSAIDRGAHVTAAAVLIAPLALAWVCARFLPPQLPRARPSRRRTRTAWLAAALPAMVALVPIGLAAGLRGYIGDSVVRLAPMPGGATAVASLPGIGLAALGGADGEVRVIDIGARPPRTLARIVSGGHAVSSLALGAEQEAGPTARVVLAVSTSDGRVHLFDARRGSRLPLPEAFAGLRDSGSKVHVGLGPGAALVVAVEMPDGAVRLVGPDGGLTVAKRGPVTALQPVAKGSVAVATLDGTIELMHLPHGEPGDTDPAGR